jgi:5'-nucleotidase
MDILLDLDDTCSQTLNAWVSLYNYEYNDNLKIEQITAWDIHNFVKEECGKKVYDLLATPEFFRHLPIFPDCARVVQKLHDAGNRVMIATSVPHNSPTAFYDKVNWVREHFPFLNKNDFFGAHEKYKIKGDLLIDDGAHNISAFPKYTCIFDKFHNQGTGATWRVSSWKEFEEKVFPELAEIYVG